MCVYVYLYIYCKNTCISMNLSVNKKHRRRDGKRWKINTSPSPFRIQIVGLLIENWKQFKSDTCTIHPAVHEMRQLRVVFGNDLATFSNSLPYAKTVDYFLSGFKDDNTTVFVISERECVLIKTLQGNAWNVTEMKILLQTKLYIFFFIKNTISLLLLLLLLQTNFFLDVQYFTPKNFRFRCWIGRLNLKHYFVVYNSPGRTL